MRWCINLGGTVIEILEIIILEIQVNPMCVMGWFKNKIKEAWKFIFPFTKESTAKGYLLVIDPLWGQILNPWWDFLTNGLASEEERSIVWRPIPQISPTPILCEVDHAESLLKRRT